MNSNLPAIQKGKPMEFTYASTLLIPPIVNFGGQEWLVIGAVLTALVPLSLLLRARWTLLPHCRPRVPSPRVLSAVNSRPA